MTGPSMSGCSGSHPKALVVSATPSTIDRFNRSNLRILKELGFEPHVATSFREFDHWSNPGFRSELETEGIVTHHIEFFRGARPTQVWSSIKEFRDLLGRVRFDLVHLQTPTAAAVGRLAMLQLGRSRPATIYTAHGFHFLRGGPPLNWLYYPIEAFLSRVTDVIVTINAEDAARARRFRGPAVELIPGVGVDPDLFQPATAADRSALRRTHGVGDGELVAVIVGELNPNKNQQLLVRAIAADRNWLVLLVGDGGSRERLQQLARELGVQDRVRFLGYRTDVAELYRMSDLLVSTSIREGLPVNVIEAMMSGLPCLVTDTRGNRDLVVDGVTGRIVRSGDVDGLTTALNFFHRHPDDRTAMGRRAHTQAVSRFSKHVVDEQMRGIYRTAGGTLINRC